MSEGNQQPGDSPPQPPPEEAAPPAEGAPPEAGAPPTAEGAAPPQAEAGAPPSGEGGVAPSTPETTEQTSPEEKNKKKASKGKNRSSSKSKRIGDLDLSSAKIGFLGAGKMAESLIEGLINHSKVAAKQIYVGAPSTKNIDRLKALGVNHSKRMIDIFGKYGCEVIFLCMHGSAIRECYTDGGKIPRALMMNYIPHVPHALYVLSLVAGVSMDQIKAVLLHPEEASSYKIEWHRIMVNAACSYGSGMCAVDVEPDSKKLSAPIRTMLSSFARLEYLPESQMDAACATGGNGLAFSYYFINALADGGFKMGISRNMAIKFAAKTSQCAAQCVLESGRHPSELLDSVCAPSGPAVYGIHVLDKADVKSGIIGAVEAAHKRAIELATTDGGSS